MSFNYNWRLADGYKPKNGLKVFTTFACGGGSTMGYKLAGFDVIGANDIDKEMEKIYKENHNPKHYFLCDIRDLVNNDNLPEELYDLDILDGSPPCSVFSMAGSREDAWGKEKKFREGQKEQTLDDLFFHFINLADKLKPKVIIAENVKGMLMGNAKKYVYQIMKRFDEIGYDVQLFLLNSSTMGVPQVRERVFFIARRKDLNLPNLQLNFNEAPIYFRDIDNGQIPQPFKQLMPNHAKWYQKVKAGKSYSEAIGRATSFTSIKVAFDKVCNTIASGSYLIHPRQERYLTSDEIIKIGSFPSDYNFLKSKPIYVIGMSVPPLMIANVAEQIHKQWFQTKSS